MGANRKKYTPAYRQEAAHLVIDTGRTIVEVAREIGSMRGHFRIGAERAGKNPDEMDFGAWVVTAVGRDSAAAEQAARSMVGTGVNHFIGPSRTRPWSRHSQARRSTAWPG